MTNARAARVPVRLVVNGVERACNVEPRWLLSDVLRQELGLTGTHVGCEHGACGACTVLVDGEPVRSCLVFGVQADGAAITTVEGLSESDGSLNALQQAFTDEHGLQCGFCTPGILMSVTALLRDVSEPTDETIRDVLSGHLCRCTGYANIVRAVKRARDQATGA